MKQTAHHQRGIITTLLFKNGIALVSISVALVTIAVFVSTLSAVMSSNYSIHIPSSLNNSSSGKSMNPITTLTLVRELYSLDSLSEYPEPYFITRQFSSYDRLSLAPDAPGWFANGDCASTENNKNYIREDDSHGRVERVIAETDKPGAIVRCWTANASSVRNNTIRFYFDGSDSPAIEENAEKFFSGNGTIPPPFAMDTPGAPVHDPGRNCMFPIPFARGCKITIEGNWHLYYHIGVREYNDDILVQTFSPADMVTWKNDFSKAADAIVSAGSLLTQNPDDTPLACTLASDERKDALTLEGPAAIDVLTIRVEADDREAALRGTVMQVFFDDSPIPQIESPVGDFFGAGPGVCPCASIPFTVTENGTMQSRFPMPFKQSARIRFKNYSGQSVAVTGFVRPKKYQWSERSMHFRAKWRVDHDVEGSGAGNDMNYLDLHGKGVWVGTALMIMNPTHNPELYGGWWGEGDEKIYIDGESFPSTFGTGSEDYFGYAWSSPDLFDNAFVGTPRCDGPGNRGFTSNYRWHLIDRLPFAKSIEFYMELQTHTFTPNISYGRIGYCYTLPGTRDNHTELTPLAVTIRYPGSYQVQGWERRPLIGFCETQNLTVIQGVVCEQQGTLWSGGSQIAWNAKKGDSLVLEVPCPGDEEHQILVLGLTTCPDGGDVTLEYAGSSHVNPDTVCLHHPVFTMVRQYSIRPAKDMPKLDAKSYQLTLTCVKSGIVGLDYIKFN